MVEPPRSVFRDCTLPVHGIAYEYGLIVVEEARLNPFSGDDRPVTAYFEISLLALNKQHIALCGHNFVGVLYIRQQIPYTVRPQSREGETASPTQVWYGCHFGQRNHASL